MPPPPHDRESFPLFSLPRESSGGEKEENRESRRGRREKEMRAGVKNARHAPSSNHLTTHSAYRHGGGTNLRGESGVSPCPCLPVPKCPFPGLFFLEDEQVCSLPFKEARFLSHKCALAFLRYFSLSLLSPSLSTPTHCTHSSTFPHTH